MSNPAWPNGTPGSPEAVKAGCLCPTIDNGRGRGYHYVEGREPHFVMVVGCPVHPTPRRTAAR